MMDYKHRRSKWIFNLGLDNTVIDKNVLRKSVSNLTKLDKSRSKSNQRENKLRETSHSFEKKNSSQQIVNNKIKDAREYVWIFNNKKLEIKKASGGLLNTKYNQFLQKSLVMPNKTNAKSINNYLTSSKMKPSNNDRSFLAEKSFYLENNRGNNNKSKEKQSNI